MTFSFLRMAFSLKGFWVGSSKSYSEFPLERTPLPKVWSSPKPKPLNDSLEAKGPIIKHK